MCYRRYGVQYLNNNADSYFLGYVLGQPLPSGWERITRQEAEALAKKAEKQSGRFGTRADVYVAPIGCTGMEYRKAIANAVHGVGREQWKLSGRVLVRV